LEALPIAEKWLGEIDGIVVGMPVFGLMPNSQHHYLEIRNTSDGALFEERTSAVGSFPTFNEGEQFIYDGRITKVTRVVNNSGDGPDGTKYFRTIIWITYN
jgi:hypothetical protein